MSKLLTKLSAAAIALAVALPAAAQDTVDADTVVASVGNENITVGNMLMVRAGLPEQYQQLPADVLWQGILDQLIQQTALSQNEDAVESKRVGIALENERRALLASEVIAKVASVEISDEAVQAAYDEKYSSAGLGREFNASHILVETEEEAATIVQELTDGADFATLAKEKSTGPSGPNGGSLGWFGPGMMVDAFQEAVEAMEVGAVSDPVQTQFGWHVIKLDETRAPEAPALDEVRDELLDELRNAAVESRIDEIVDGTDVVTSETEFDTSILDRLDLLED